MRNLQKKLIIIWQPPNLILSPPFLAKILRPLHPAISINFEKVEPCSNYGNTLFLHKVHAIEPSSAKRNAKKTANALIDKYGGRENVPPMLIVYTEGGLEHCFFLNVKITMIALLDLGILIVAKTAPGHSYTNPPEKINCILNLGLIAIGCMRTAIHSNPGFKKQLSNFSGVGDVKNVETP